MASFQEKLQTFLAQARQEQLIDEQLLTSLSTFATQQNEHSSLVSKLNNFIYIIGAVLALLGTGLLISYNWSNIPNLVKLISYLGLLIGITLLALYTTNQLLASTLIFIESGLVLVGIGLIAQIYNLSEHTGSTFLIWCLLILPTTVLLNWKWLNCMSCYAFYHWLLQYLGYIDAFESVYIPILLGTALIFLKLDRANQYPWLTKCIYLMGIFYYFALLFGPQREASSPLQLHPFCIILILLAAASTGYLIRRRQHPPLPLLYIWLFSATPLFLVYVPNWFYTFFINSIWIALPVLLIIHGIKQIQPKFINSGSILLIFYIGFKFTYYYSKSMLSVGTICLSTGICVIVLAIYFQQIQQRLTTYSRQQNESKN